ncbi:MAG: hypothetical protein CMJ46_16120, partial [Planctomyces sp.]|nr:hypothetical protein [Planctomyces sp.]
MNCPSPEILQQLAKGACTGPFLDEVLEHTSCCEVCLQTLENTPPLSADELLESRIAQSLTLAEFNKEAEFKRIFAGTTVANSDQGSEEVGREVFPVEVNKTKLGDFRLVRLIARGGMGMVYEAEQVSLERRVAIKILSRSGQFSDRDVQRFQNEAMAAARLDHDHIVPINSVGKVEGCYFLTMKFIDGSDLARIMEALSADEPDGSQLAKAPWLNELQLGRTEKVISNDSYIRFIVSQFAEVADALHYAHDRGIIHRDIKPSNLLVNKSGRFWISDFGIAKLDQSNELTITGAVVGTPRYMSPEQASGRRVAVDHRTDIYSLGATLYEALTLRPIFDAAGQYEIYTKIAEEEPVHPRQLNPAIPLDLETII